MAGAPMPSTRPPGLSEEAVFCGASRVHHSELRPAVEVAKAAFPEQHAKFMGSDSVKALTVSLQAGWPGGAACPDARLAWPGRKWHVSSIGKLQLPRGTTAVELWRDGTVVHVCIPLQAPQPRGPGGGADELASDEPSDDGDDEDTSTEESHGSLSSGDGSEEQAEEESEEPVEEAAAAWRQPGARGEVPPAPAAAAGAIGDSRCCRKLSGWELTKQMRVTSPMTAEGGVFQRVRKGLIKGLEGKRTLRFYFRPGGEGEDVESYTVKLELGTKGGKDLVLYTFSRMTHALGLKEGDTVLFRPHRDGHPTHFDVEGWRMGPGGPWQRLQPPGPQLDAGAAVSSGPGAGVAAAAAAAAAGAEEGEAEQLAGSDYDLVTDEVPGSTEDDDEEAEGDEEDEGVGEAAATQQMGARAEVRPVPAAADGAIGDPLCCRKLSGWELTKQMRVPSPMTAVGGVFEWARKGLQGKRTLRFCLGPSGEDQNERWLELELGMKGRKDLVLYTFSRMAHALRLEEGDTVLFRPHSGADPTHFDVEGWRMGQAGGWQRLSPRAEAAAAPRRELTPPRGPLCSAGSSGDDDLPLARLVAATTKQPAAASLASAAAASPAARPPEPPPLSAGGVSPDGAAGRAEGSAGSSPSGDGGAGEVPGGAGSSLAAKNPSIMSLEDAPLSVLAAERRKLEGRKPVRASGGVSLAAETADLAGGGNDGLAGAPATKPLQASAIQAGGGTAGGFSSCPSTLPEGFSVPGPEGPVLAAATQGLEPSPGQQAPAQPGERRSASPGQVPQGSQQEPADRAETLRLPTATAAPPTVAVGPAPGSDGAGASPSAADAGAPVMRQPSPAAAVSLPSSLALIPARELHQLLRMAEEAAGAATRSTDAHGGGAGAVGTQAVGSSPAAQNPSVMSPEDAPLSIRAPERGSLERREPSRSTGEGGTGPVLAAATQGLEPSPGQQAPAQPGERGSEPPGQVPQGSQQEPADRAEALRLPDATAAPPAAAAAGPAPASDGPGASPSAVGAGAPVMRQPSAAASLNALSLLAPAPARELHQRLRMTEGAAGAATRSTDAHGGGAGAWGTVADGSEAEGGCSSGPSTTEGEGQPEEAGRVTPRRPARLPSGAFREPCADRPGASPLSAAPGGTSAALQLSPASAPGPLSPPAFLSVAELGSLRNKEPSVVRGPPNRTAASEAAEAARPICPATTLLLRADDPHPTSAAAKQGPAELEPAAPARARVQPPSPVSAPAADDTLPSVAPAPSAPERRPTREGASHEAAPRPCSDADVAVTAPRPLPQLPAPPQAPPPAPPQAPPQVSPQAPPQALPQAPLPAPAQRHVELHLPPTTVLPASSDKAAETVGGAAQASAPPMLPAVKPDPDCPPSQPPPAANTVPSTPEPAAHGAAEAGPATPANARMPPQADSCAAIAGGTSAPAAAAAAVLPSQRPTGQGAGSRLCSFTLEVPVTAAMLRDGYLRVHSAFAADAGLAPVGGGTAGPASPPPAPLSLPLRLRDASSGELARGPSSGGGGGLFVDSTLSVTPASPGRKAVCKLLGLGGWLAARGVTERAVAEGATVQVAFKPPGAFTIAFHGAQPASGGSEGSDVEETEDQEEAPSVHNEEAGEVQGQPLSTSPQRLPRSRGRREAAALGAAMEVALTAPPQRQAAKVARATIAAAERGMPSRQPAALPAVATPRPRAPAAAGMPNTAAASAVRIRVATSTLGSYNYTGLTQSVVAGIFGVSDPGKAEHRTRVPLSVRTAEGSAGGDGSAQPLEGVRLMAYQHQQRTSAQWRLVGLRAWLLSLGAVVGDAVVLRRLRQGRDAGGEVQQYSIEFERQLPGGIPPTAPAPGAAAPGAPDLSGAQKRPRAAGAEDAEGQLQRASGGGGEAGPSSPAPKRRKVTVGPHAGRATATRAAGSRAALSAPQAAKRRARGGALGPVPANVAESAAPGAASAVARIMRTAGPPPPAGRSTTAAASAVRIRVCASILDPRQKNSYLNVSQAVAGFFGVSDPGRAEHLTRVPLSVRPAEGGTGGGGGGSAQPLEGVRLIAYHPQRLASAIWRLVGLKAWLLSLGARVGDLVLWRRLPRGAGGGVQQYRVQLERQEQEQQDGSPSIAPALGAEATVAPHLSGAQKRPRAAGAADAEGQLQRAGGGGGEAGPSSPAPKRRKVTVGPGPTQALAKRSATVAHRAKQQRGVPAGSRAALSASQAVKRRALGGGAGRAAASKSPRSAALNVPESTAPGAASAAAPMVRTAGPPPPAGTARSRPAGPPAGPRAPGQPGVAPRPTEVRIPVTANAMSTSGFASLTTELASFFVDQPGKLPDKPLELRIQPSDVGSGAAGAGTAGAAVLRGMKLAGYAHCARKTVTWRLQGMGMRSWLQARGAQVGDVMVWQRLPPGPGEEPEAGAAARFSLRLERQEPSNPAAGSQGCAAVAAAAARKPAVGATAGPPAGSGTPGQSVKRQRQSAEAPSNAAAAAKLPRVAAPTAALAQPGALTAPPGVPMLPAEAPSDAAAAAAAKQVTAPPAAVARPEPRAVAALTAALNGGVQARAPKAEPASEPLPVGPVPAVNLPPPPPVAQPAAHLPAASVSHLHGCLPPGVPLPPLQPGELRLCGLTFQPDLAPSVRRTMQEWEASSSGGGCRLAALDPSTQQISIPGVDGDAGGSEGALAASAAFSRHGLRRPILATRLARHLGIYTHWDAPLPSGPLPLSPDLVAPGPDPERGGAGLFARAAIKPSWVLGVVGGYVMPRAAAEAYAARGLRQGQHLQAAMTDRAGGSTEDADSAWGFLAGSFRLRLPGLGPSPCGADGCELSMLGYGNEAALVNDPRRNPRAWAPGNDVGDEEGSAANCMVLPVSVRGLVLPVLVALRDIAPGEQLLRDYGAEWWRQLGDLWEVAEDAGLSPEALLHGEQGAGACLPKPTGAGLPRQGPSDGRDRTSAPKPVALPKAARADAPGSADDHDGSSAAKPDAAKPAAERRHTPLLAQQSAAPGSSRSAKRHRSRSRSRGRCSGETQRGRSKDRSGPVGRWQSPLWELRRSLSPRRAHPATREQGSGREWRRSRSRSPVRQAPGQEVRSPGGFSVRPAQQRGRSPGRSDAWDSRGGFGGGGGGPRRPIEEPCRLGPERRWSGWGAGPGREEQHARSGPGGWEDRPPDPRGYGPERSYLAGREWGRGSEQGNTRAPPFHQPPFAGPGAAWGDRSRARPRSRSPQRLRGRSPPRGGGGGGGPRWGTGQAAPRYGEQRMQRPRSRSRSPQFRPRPPQPPASGAGGDRPQGDSVGMQHERVRHRSPRAEGRVRRPSTPEPSRPPEPRTAVRREPPRAGATAAAPPLPPDLPPPPPPPLPPPLPLPAGWELRGMRLGEADLASASLAPTAAMTGPGGVLVRLAVALQGMAPMRCADGADQQGSGGDGSGGAGSRRLQVRLEAYAAAESSGAAVERRGWTAELSWGTDGGLRLRGLGGLFAALGVGPGDTLMLTPVAAGVAAGRTFRVELRRAL